MWGDAIQRAIMNYLMMNMMKDKQPQPNPASQAATVGPVGGQNSTMPMQPMPGQQAPSPQDMPGLLQMMMQYFMQQRR